MLAATDSDSGSLDVCLHALRGQVHHNFDVLVMLYGPSNSAAMVAQTHAAEDWRVRVPSVRSRSRGEARNRGAALAKGGFLAFADPRDVPPPSGLRTLFLALSDSHSDFAVGRMSEAPGPFRNIEPVHDPAHTMLRQGVSLVDFPLAITDTHDENRLFRTDFWRRAGLSFAEDESNGARTPVLDAYARATAFDMLPEVTCLRTDRGDGTPFGALRDSMTDLDGWLADQEKALAFLDDLGSAKVREAWAAIVCDVTALRFVEDAERATEKQWKALREFLHVAVQPMSADAWAMVRAEARIKVWLALEDRREELMSFIERRWFERGDRPTDVVDGVVHARLPYYQDPRVGVPASSFVMHERETQLNVILRSARWTDASTLELDLFTYIDFVGYEDEAPEVEIDLVNLTSGQRTPLRLQQRSDPEVTLTVGHRHQRYDEGAVTAFVDATELTRLADESGASAEEVEVGWRLDVRVSARGLSRANSVTRRDDKGSADLLGTAVLAGRTCGQHRVNLLADRSHGIRVTVSSAPPVRLRDAGIDGRRVEGRLSALGPQLTAVTASRPDGLRVQAPLTVSDRGGLAFALDLPDVGYATGGTTTRFWVLRGLDRDGTEHPIDFPDQTPDLWLGSGPASEVVVGRTEVGNCEIVEAANTAVIEDAHLEADHVLVRGRWLGAPPPEWTLRLRSKRATLRAAEVTGDGSEFEAVVPIRWDEWGLGATPVPVGQYLVEVRHGEGGDALGGRTLMGEAIIAKLMEPSTNDDFRMTPIKQGRALAIKLMAPLRDDERGPYRQKRLQEWLAACEEPIDQHAVYMQSYTGVSATDSQRAIHDELRRQRPELTIYWAVADRSTRVPEGGTPLLIQSREWYRVLATAKYLCNNIDFERWFEKRPGQQFLQTFHGYPAKSMGLRLWKAKQFTPRRLALEIERTSRDWDLILTPAPEMDVHYRVEYGYDGEIESAGYPRDDTLVSPDADRIRRETRKRLGLRDDQTAVLYAPTWRDDLATSHRSAPLVRHLDLETASEALGDDFVFLMRGHRFHARGSRRRSSTARLLDVTDYPEINDLILAADVAVLDYSSLRFDFSLTGRPMLFLVPDLPTYVGGIRGFLYPFEESAPGPLLEDAEDVVERLKDLPTVQEEVAAEYERFNKRFNYLQDGRAAERVVARFFT